MCLVSKWIFPRKAKEDIVCYKVFIVTQNPDTHEIIEAVTPFMYEEVNILQPIKAISKKSLLKRWWHGICEPYIKTDGYIHTVRNISLAKELIKYYQINGGEIFKCIIPKGTKYHVGEGNTDLCSKTIKVIQLI